MDNPQSKRKTFTKRPGTTDKGKAYEDILAAFLAFKLVNDNDVEDFNLSSNNFQYGSFDDIVLESIDAQKVSKIHAIQLKHKENITKTVTRDQLAASKGDFSLQKYFECFKDIKKKYKHTNLNCYLYTNVNFENSSKFTFKLKDKKDIEVSARLSLLSDKDIFNTSDNKFVYQFEMTQDNGSVDPEIAEYKDFFDHFFFYSNQKNVDEMENYTLDIFQKEYFCEKSFFEKYMEFIRKWSEMVGKKDCLNKELISFKIGECLLRPLAINVPLSNGNNSKFGVLQQVFLHFDATILQTDEELVKGSLSEIFSQISNVDANNASEIAAEFFIETRRKISFDKLDEDQKVTVLWYMNKLPLILPLDGSKKILKHAEKFCQRKKFIFIGQYIDRSDCQNLQIFQNLQDLPKDSSMYKKIVQETKISLQGRQETSLEDLIRNYEEIEEAFTPLELMNTTDGYLRVGEDKEELPHPYITQFLPKYVIDFKFLQQNHTESLSVINAKQRLDNIKEKISGVKLVTVEEYLEEPQKSEVEESIRSLPKISKSFDTNEPFLLVAEDQCSFEEFRRICDKSPNKPCHVFCINSDSSLEWIRSNGDIEDLKKYKSVSNYISEAEIFSSSNTKINLITGRPGMGKTVLLKYLKNNIPSNFWVVNISLREHFLFFREEHSNSEILNYLVEDQAKKLKYNNFTIKIRNIFQSKRNIVFLWDGLDEVPNNCLNEALKSIEGLSNFGFINWITAREHLQPMLESKLKVFALNIKEMEQEEQKSYIKKRLASEECSQKIIEALATTGDVSFLGIPFHINILTELFVYDAEKYNNLLNSTFTVADMIEHSVEERLNFCFKEKFKCEDNNLGNCKILEEYRENRISQYESLALRTFFSAEDIVDKLHINFQPLLTKIKLSKDDFGIIVGVNQDERAIFIHNIYGEYFVASWMTKNLELVQNFKNFFFEKAYNNIRLIFDTILAKNCPAHLAVLHHNFTSLRKNQNEIMRRDKAGRSPLHLACSWGERRPVLPIEKIENLYLIDDTEAKTLKEDTLQYKKILNFLIEETESDPFEKDRLYSWDCVEYASNSSCLFAVEVLGRNKNLKLSPLQKFNDYNICYYGIRFGYMNLLQMVETVPYVELRRNRNHFLHEAVSYGRNKCIAKILTNPIYLKRINKENNNRQFIARKESTTAIFPKMSESVADLLKRKSGLELIEEDNTFRVYKVLTQTPLHIAATNGNLEAIKILLERGADVNFVNNCTDSALSLATKNQHLDIVKILLTNKASINQINVCGENVLHIAARTGNSELIEYLLQQNVRFTSDKFNTNPLHHVVVNNHMDTLEIILKYINLLPKYERKSYVFDSFVYMIEKGRTEMVKYLLGNGVNVNEIDRITRRTPLHQAAAFGHLEIVKFLITKKANINVSDRHNITPLHLAVAEGHIEILKLLIEEDAILDKSDDLGGTPLHYAAYFGKPEAVELLIKKKANINSCDRLGRTPLHISVLKKELRIMEILLDSGADCNQTDLEGVSVLVASISLKHEEIYQVLIKNCRKYGLDLDLQSRDAICALGVAVQKNDVDAMKLLLEQGANKDVNFFFNRSIVHLASQSGAAEILKVLIKHGADINFPDQDMLTPLHFAANFGRIDCARILLENGADACAKALCGRIPRQFAAKKGYHELCQLLDSFVIYNSSK